MDKRDEGAEFEKVDRLEEQLGGLLSLMEARLEGPKVRNPLEQNCLLFYLLACTGIQLFERDVGYLAC